LKSIFVMF